MILKISSIINILGGLILFFLGDRFIGLSLFLLGAFYLYHTEYMK